MRMIINKQNKKGAMLLRDVMFTIAIFGTLIALMSIFVTDMAREYGNTNMSNDYSVVQSNGSQIFDRIESDVEQAKDDFKDPNSGIFTYILDLGQGIGNFLITLIGLPFFLAAYVEGFAILFGVPSGVAEVAGTFLMVILYIVIIFGIGTAISRGSKM